MPKKKNTQKAYIERVNAKLAIIYTAMLLENDKDLHCA
jgi:hypothetical protein